ncbi:hypothetical protein [Aliarcobacter cryaerophilus]|jgi:hypothetical protein|uniref:hypothetical protein n=1 Tax=Aliarcobacter cryaerophilus TaxID=28198 RepID=UPI0021B18DF0|nr:hypothetical protein [Aliarcobacter cryaerophilus]MCT7468512.1 hypothetical protein [Aliarcobacter cryaerophilus]MCT7472153.1 hypothetical protein [Aliarcobacter cryaerophilus]MCT7488357.1 hypothetical protein [Aliarcobacter cryaerophilus]MCT7525965.1 hypothetical protein [Aliarcobacter cryaerophilus]MCT7532255.1 hypothetical protein [Aliarcobacter cryaerophilus]
MKIKNISKILIIFILSLTNLEAGFIMNKIKDKAKDKVKDVTVDTTKEVYNHRKEKRRDYEAKTNTKSTLSKAEDNIESTKKLVKDTAVGSFGGQENVDYVKRGAGYFKKTLKGEPVD